ncbi:hypothetical protein JTE90_002668 [Oedothorax gibbosus]|uniref:Uncharacterized protein n=1 Tax=Oedothorax gibbosus TaxID=931172 RepID=A0AAV6U2M2_9ARAC|nr:hypothetical protein JTE90_002668 [Oedothorax gibbosus]
MKILYRNSCCLSSHLRRANPFIRGNSQGRASKKYLRRRKRHQEKEKSGGRGNLSHRRRRAHYPLKYRLAKTSEHSFGESVSSRRVEEQQRAGAEPHKRVGIVVDLTYDSESHKMRY